MNDAISLRFSYLTDRKQKPLVPSMVTEAILTMDNQIVAIGKFRHHPGEAKKKCRKMAFAHMLKVVPKYARPYYWRDYFLKFPKDGVFSLPKHLEGIKAEDFESLEPMFK